MQSYPQITQNTSFCWYQWYGYAGNPANYQDAQQANVSALRARMAELQVQQYCCNQVATINARLAMLNNCVQVPMFLERTSKIDLVEELDKILFPENPIRDYIKEEVRKVKEKYAKRIEQLNAFLT